MSIQKFNHFKDRFNATKPIRGRAVETRPIGQRRRDWEQVVKRYIVDEGVLDVEGGEAYGAHLYRTDCVMFTAHGDMYLRTDGYETPTTAEFINRYIPRDMKCFKKYNKIWIQYKDNSYVMENTKPLIFRFDKLTDGYKVENPVQLQQKVVDKTKMKAARTKLTAFRNYAKVMLKLADGWLSNDLVNTHAVGQSDYYGRKGFEIDGQQLTYWNLNGQVTPSTATLIYNAMCTDDETQFPKLLCMICAGSNSKDTRTIRTEQVERTDYNGNKRTENITVREYQYDYKTVDNRINYMIKAVADVYTTREVAMGVVATNTL